MGELGIEYSHFFEVKLDLFNGPIDLLLHLVKQRELPLEKVSLAAVADQYMQCIEDMRHYDLEVAGEYLVIAATLVSMKSSILLNEPVELVQDEDGNLVDPHEQLLRRLREAEVYKDAASHLGRTPVLGLDVFAPPSSLKDYEDVEVRLCDHDPLLLGKAFQKVLEKAGTDTKLITISVDSVTIVERMVGILDRLRTAGPKGVVFYSLIPDLSSRGAIISTFVALLELCKRQAIRVRQERSWEDIFIAISDGEVQSAGLTSEFDEQKSEAQGA
ncbi:MAG: segregation/condensation protein A [Oligoflexia bacterium]|nr:segregation/condensation protein A [Oligoflexia bacterium]